MSTSGATSGAGSSSVAGGDSRDSSGGVGTRTRVGGGLGVCARGVGNLAVQFALRFGAVRYR